MAHTYNKLYNEITNWRNLVRAWKKARKHKTKKKDIIEFEANLRENLLKLQEELKKQTYKPKPLKDKIIKDPKTRKISISDFRDRIIHHAICNIIEPIFDKRFIYDSCANRKGKGNLFAIKRFDDFAREISENGKLKNLIDNNQIKGYCLKADIKHYFEEVNHNILISIIQKKIKDEKAIWLIKQILNNLPKTRSALDPARISHISFVSQSRSPPPPERDKKGMPLGNLTSQFFANVYLNELDQFVKHKLRAKYYIRYVDDFVIIHQDKKQLSKWKQRIEEFLAEKLGLELHPQKSKVVSLSRGVDFVGFRNFYHFKLLRKRNLRKISFRIEQYREGKISKEKLLESFNGWNAYAKWANSLGIRRGILKRINALINTR